MMFMKNNGRAIVGTAPRILVLCRYYCSTRTTTSSRMLSKRRSSPFLFSSFSSDWSSSLLLLDTVEEKMSIHRRGTSSRIRRQGRTIRRMTTASSSSSNNTMNPIYVSATRQHVGKTSVSLAIMSGLQKRFPKRVGFIKPVGQQAIQVDVVDEQQNSSTSNDKNDDNDDGNDDDDTNNNNAAGEGTRRRRNGRRILAIDKDAVLVKQHFQLDHIDYEDTSPILIPQGYTRNYLDQKISYDDQQTALLNSFQRICDVSDIILCEGTGHCGVGSIVDMGNARVASILNASIVLVANGGLGKCIDELELNRALCQKHNVHIAGVIVNKVRRDKYTQTVEYLRKALARWNDNDHFIHQDGNQKDDATTHSANSTQGSTVPLLGCIPDRPFLGCPALKDLEMILGAAFVCGHDHRLRHYKNSDVQLVATSLNVFLKRLRQERVENQKLLLLEQQQQQHEKNSHNSNNNEGTNKSSSQQQQPQQQEKRTLYICHASRNDILLGYLMESLFRASCSSTSSTAASSSSASSGSSSSSSSSSASSGTGTSAMIVTGCKEYPISTQVLEIVTGLPSSSPPVLMTSLPTDVVMETIYAYTPKLNTADTHRVMTTVEHYEPYIDFDTLLQRVGYNNNKNNNNNDGTTTTEDHNDHDDANNPSPPTPVVAV